MSTSHGSPGVKHQVSILQDTAIQKSFHMPWVSLNTWQPTWLELECLHKRIDRLIVSAYETVGIDPDYKEVNAILVAIDDLCQSYLPSLPGMVQFANREAPYCFKCYGMKKLDWIQYAQGTFRKKFADRKRKAREGFLEDVQPFLVYVSFGETHIKIKGRPKYLHFDLEAKSWVKVKGPKDDIDSLRGAFKWLHRFRDDDCWDIETAGHIPLKYQELFWTRLEEHLKTIKAELLRSAELPMERFIEIKNDLDLFWYKIEKLNEIGIEDTANGKPSTEFKFTWENILKKFDLPLDQLAFLNSEKIEHKK